MTIAIHGAMTIASDDVCEEVVPCARLEDVFVIQSGNKLAWIFRNRFQHNRSWVQGGLCESMLLEGHMVLSHSMLVNLDKWSGKLV